VRLLFAFTALQYFAARVARDQGFALLSFVLSNNKERASDLSFLRELGSLTELYIIKRHSYLFTGLIAHE
jgi:hypothetical protein